METKRPGRPKRLGANRHNIWINNLAWTQLVIGQDEFPGRGIDRLVAEEKERIDAGLDNKNIDILEDYIRTKSYDHWIHAYARHNVLIKDDTWAWLRNSSETPGHKIGRLAILKAVVERERRQRKLALSSQGKDSTVRIWVRGRPDLK